MLSYVDDFAMTAASLSYPRNIRPLQELFGTFHARAVRLGISFSVLKTELIHRRTPSQRHSQTCLAPIQLDGEIFHPRDSLQWLGYGFTPTLSTSTQYSRRLALAHGAFALIRRLSRPGAGLAPYLYHRLATSLLTPILLYGADLFTPNAGSIMRLNTLWYKVQGWATNCFSSTPISILAIESCLPPIPLLVSQRQTLAALRTVCSPPGINPATARLHSSFPSLSSYRTPDNSRAHTKGLLSVYHPLSGKTPRPSPPLRNHLPIDAVAHRTIAFTSGLSKMPMINAHLGPEVSALLHPQSQMMSTYSALKKRVREALVEEWSRLFPPCLLLPPPCLTPSPLYGPRQVHGRADPPNDSREWLPPWTPLLGARTPRKDLQGKVTLPWRIRTSKEKDNTPLQPRRWDGASSLAAWVVASQHQRPISMEHIS